MLLNEVPFTGSSTLWFCYAYETVYNRKIVYSISWINGKKDDTIKEAVFFRLSFHLSHNKKFRQTFNHRIVWARRDLQRFPAQPPVQRRSKWNRTVSDWILNIQRHRHSASSLGNLVQGDTHWIKKKSSIFSLNNLCSNFCLLPLILVLFTSENSQGPAFLCPPLGTLV